MARQQEDGTFKSVRGHTYDNEGAAQADNRRFHAEGGNQGALKSMGSFLDVFGKLIWIIPLLGLLAIFALLGLAFFRGYLILATRLPLFGVAGIIGLVFGSIGFIFSKGFARVFVLIILTLVIGIPLCFGAYGIYTQTDRYFATMFSHDYVQALPDGSAPKLYEKRNNKGRVLTELKIEERVTVNGITLNSKNFNITTAAGLTGWVELNAFPKNAAEMLGIVIEMGGFEQEQIQRDRHTIRLMEKYMEGEPFRRTSKGEPLEYSWKLSQDAQNRFIRVNAQTPLLSLNSKDYREGGKLKELLVPQTVTLDRILYADDCTIIHLYTEYDYTKTRDGRSLLGGKGNTNAWHKGLIVTDLSTGIVYPVMEADYAVTHNIEVIPTGSTTYRAAITYFFPPFKSKYFSLTRTALPMPLMTEVKGEYGGVLGLLDNMISGNWEGRDGSLNYEHWEFPEVRVR